MINLEQSPSDVLAWQVTNALGLVVEREYRFDPVRRWRLDCYIASARLAVEVDGGIWRRDGKGAHTRPLNILRDMEKSNALTLAGIRLLRVTPDQVKDGSALDLVQQALGREE